MIYSTGPVTVSAQMQDGSVVELGECQMPQIGRVQTDWHFSDQQIAAFAARLQRAAQAVLPVVEAAAQTWRALGEWLDAHPEVLLLASILAADPGRSQPEQSLSLDELRQLAGGDGATHPAARFDAEGGFSPN